MKKLRKTIILTMVIMAALTAGILYFLGKGGSVSADFADRIAEDQSDQSESRAYFYDIDKSAIPLQTSGDNKNVLNFDSKNPYQKGSSAAARERLDRLVKRADATFEKPIIAANPFGTNENSFYFYFTTSYKGMVRYTVTVDDKSIPDHVRYVNNGRENNLTKTHEFAIAGMVPGKVNYIVVEVLDSTGAQREKYTYKYEMPNSTASARLTFRKKSNKGICKNGLYFVFPKSDSKIYAYDNMGVLRDTILTESAHGSRMYQLGNCVLYQVSPVKVAKVSSVGQVMDTAEVKGYGEIRDFSYDGYDNIYSLARKNGRDYLLATSFQTGVTRAVYEFPKSVRTFSLTEPVGGSVYVSCSKPSGIAKLTSLTSQKPKVAVILGKKDDWKSVPSKKKSWKNKVAGGALPARWDTAAARLNLVPGSSDGKKDTLATYLSDKGKGTGVVFSVNGKEEVKAKQSFPIGWGGKCSCETYEDRFILSNLAQGVFAEYDTSGRYTKEFSFGRALDAVTKLSLNGMCFYEG